MRFVKTDCGRAKQGFAGERFDCMVRAFALTHKLPYRRAHAIIEKETGRVRGTPTTVGDPPGDDPSDFKWLSRYYKPVRWNVNKLADYIIPPAKRCLMLGYGHVFACIDGTSYDTEDNRGMLVACIWEPR